MTEKISDEELRQLSDILTDPPLGISSASISLSTKMLTIAQELLDARAEIKRLKAALNCPVKLHRTSADEIGKDWTRT